MAQPLDAAELQILEDTDLNHKWYKRYIKALVDQENLAATDWKTAQNEHMRVSLELQREQTALALIREMLADNLVGTVDDVEQQVETVMQEAMDLASKQGGAVPAYDPPYCKQGAFRAAGPVRAQIPKHPWSEELPVFQRDRLEKLTKKLPLDEQRVDQLEKNALARKLACEKLTEQIKSMILQCARMKRVRKEIKNALKTVWTDEVGQSRTVRNRFVLFQDLAEKRAESMAKSTTERLTKLINAESVHLAEPQGAVTWLNSWAQLGRRSHATPLCQTDYKLDVPKALYSSGDDDENAQQAAGPSNAPQPPGGGGVAQARVDQVRVQRNREKYMMVLQKHVEERIGYILEQYRQDASRIRLWWDVRVQDKISEHGRLVVEGTEQETGATHLLNLHDPDIKDTWLRWGEARGIPEDVIEDMMSEYIAMIHNAITEKIVPVLRNEYGWKDSVEYKSASDLDKIYNEGRPSVDFRQRPLMQRCLLIGASSRTYKFQKSSIDRDDSHQWGKKFEDREGEFHNWFYNRERTIGFVTSLKHGLPTENQIAEGYLKEMDMGGGEQSARDESSDDDDMGAIDVQNLPRKAPADEATRSKHAEAYIEAGKRRAAERAKAEQKKEERQRLGYWNTYLRGVNQGGFELENQKEAKDAENWLIANHKEWFEDKKQKLETQRKKEQAAARQAAQAEEEQRAWQEEFDKLEGYKFGDLEELLDL